VPGPGATARCVQLVLACAPRQAPHLSNRLRQVDSRADRRKPRIAAAVRTTASTVRDRTLGKPRAGPEGSRTPRARGHLSRISARVRPANGELTDVRTVDTHRAHIMRKLHLERRAPRSCSLRWRTD